MSQQYPPNGQQTYAPDNQSLVPVALSPNSEVVNAAQPPGNIMSTTADCKGSGPIIIGNPVSTQVAIEDNKQQESIEVKKATEPKQKPIPIALRYEQRNISLNDSFKNKTVNSPCFIPQFQNTNKVDPTRVQNYDIFENKTVIRNNQVQTSHIFQETEKQQRNGDVSTSI
jgi:hypothetical protein